MEFIDDLRQEFDGQRPMEELSREIISYIKPDAPLYALQSTLPAICGADAVKEAFSNRFGLVLASASGSPQILA